MSERGTRGSVASGRELYARMHPRPVDADDTQTERPRSDRERQDQFLARLDEKRRNADRAQRRTDERRRIRNAVRDAGLGRDGDDAA